MTREMPGEGSPVHLGANAPYQTLSPSGQKRAEDSGLTFWAHVYQKELQGFFLSALCSEPWQKNHYGIKNEKTDSGSTWGSF